VSRLPARAAVLFALLLLCTAHVGSPDVWYEGEAGPYHIIVYVRVPGAIPGIADINVRVVNDDVDQVTAMVNLFATADAPPPDVATPTGSGGWYETRLWIMSPGSNSVTVAVKGDLGTGSVVVPVTAVANRRLALDQPLGLTLAGFGIFLFAGVITIAGAAVREGVLPPGEVPAPERARSARRVMFGTAAFFGLLLYGGKTWWDGTDAAFRREMYRPFRAVASVAPAESASALHFDITDPAWVMRGDSAWLRAHRLDAWSPLVPDHGKLMHLFLVREGGMGALAHLHPVTDDSIHFSNRLPALPAGRYRVFGDIVHASGFAKTLVATVDVPEGVSASSAPAADDAIYVGGGNADLDTLPDGATIGWRRGATPLVEGRPSVLSFDVREASGSPAVLEPYLGMPAHAVVARDDGEVFIHLHPMGTISTASQESFTPRRHGDSAAGHTMGMTPMVPMPANGHLTFPYAFPQPGKYRIWVQVKRRGQIETAGFDAEVGGAS